MKTPGRTRRPRSLLASAVLLASCVQAMAQSGGLEVRVLEAATGTPLAGATVVLDSTQRRVAPTAGLTDAQGRVEFPVLPSGRGYRLEISLPGYGGRRVPEIRIRSGEIERFVVQLAPDIEERIRVRAERDVIDVDRVGSSTRFSDEFIENLPVPGRFYQSLLTLTPGVKDADEDGNPNVHGARSRDFKALVNGVSNVDPLTGEWLSYVHTESIEELEVITIGAGVEFGRAQGGFARIIQKQGSNELEGVFSFLYRSSLFDRNGATELSGDDLPEFEWIQPSLQLSGPVVRDRLWFRLSHESIRREDPVNSLGRVELTTRRQSLSADQLTWQVSPRNKLAFQFQHDPLRIESFELSSAVPAEASRDFARGGTTYGLRWTGTSSARLIVEGLASYQDSGQEVVPSTRDLQQRCVIFQRYAVLDRAFCLDTDLNQYSGSFPESVEDRRQRLTSRGEATWYAGRWLGMNHRLKLGFVVENERYFRDLERRPEIRFRKIRLFFPPPPFYGDLTTQVPVPRSSRARATGTSWAVYVEDQLKPADRLAITLGLRLDREEIDSEGRSAFDPAREAQRFFELYAGCIDSPTGGCESRIARDVFTAFEGVTDFQGQLAEALGVSPDLVVPSPNLIQTSFWPRRRRAENVALVNTHLSPRLAVGWDPWGRGKSKLGLSAGRYHDKLFLAVPLIELEPTTTEFASLAFPPFDASTPLIVRGLLDAANAVVSTRVVDRGLRTPYQDEFALSAEQELWRESSIKLTYVRRRFRDQLQDVDINHGRNGIVLNPGWGELLLVGNFNRTDYSAYVLELVRRQYRGWQLQGSYTYSRARGAAEDFDQLLGNNADLLAEEQGFLAYDQRHVALVNFISLARRGYRLGGTLRWESGLPYSILRSTRFPFVNPPEYENLGAAGFQAGFVYPTGQRNDQRNEGFWTVDLRVARELALGRTTQLQWTAEVFNLLNDDTLRQLDRVDGANDGTRRFGRRFQLGLRLAF